MDRRNIGVRTRCRWLEWLTARECSGAISSSFQRASSNQGADGCAEDLVGAGERGFALLGGRTRDGMEGARLTAGPVFYDLRNAVALTASAVIFQGICNPPDEILEATFRIRRRTG